MPVSEKFCVLVPSVAMVAEACGGTAARNNRNTGMAPSLI
jgi:hypothetical protein